MSRPASPPTDVPTLTEIVQPGLVSGPAPSGVVAMDQGLPEMQELMVQRVLRRIDLVLERRLHEAIEQLILEQADALLPRLRDEIELVVRESVTQAFEQESASFSGRLESCKQDVS